MPETGLNTQQIIEALYCLPSSTGIYVGPDLRIVAMNETLLRFWGKDRSVFGKTIEEAIPELEGQPFIPMLRKVWATGETYEAAEQKMDVPVAGKLQTRYYDYAFRAIKDTEGNMICILHTAMDVSDRVVSRTRTLQNYFSNLSLEVSEGEAALMLAIESAGLALWSLDLESHNLYVSDRQRELFGLPEKADIKVDHILRIVVSDDMDAIRARIVEAIHQNLKVEFEYRIRHPVTQQIRWIRGFCKSVGNGEGQAVSVFGVNMDITDQLKSADLLKEYNQNLKEANNELRGVISRLTQSEERLSLAISSADLGTWHLDLTTREFITSPRLKQLFGFLPHEAMSEEAVNTQIVEEHRARVMTETKLAIREERAYEIEYPIVGFHDGKTRWVRATGKVFPANEQHGAYFSGTVADVTERLQEEQRRNDFMSMVSHELKTPLTSVKGYLQLMRMNTPADDQLGIESFERSLKQIDKMTGMINGFLDVSQLEFGQVRIDKEVFDLAQLLKEAEQESLATITSHKIVYAPVEFTLISADPAKISQVIQNLISNALKYSPPGSTINVACVTRNGNAYVSVKDAGIGIEAKDLDKVFDRFYRVQNAQGKAVGGFGIGLYISKYIIERHDGKIWAESEFGKGTTICFTLPVA